MNISSAYLGRACEYDEYDGGMIRADRGEGLPFTNIDGQPCHMGKGSRTEDGRRKVVLKITTWVGSSALNAVHFYARLEAGGVDHYFLDSDPTEPQYRSGHGDSCKPKASKRIEIQVVRPTTQRDIDHWLAFYGEDNPNREWQCPKLDGHERGFWERGEAVKAGKAVFDQWFDPTEWALYLDDPDMEFEHSEEPWEDSFLDSFTRPKPKTRHDDWRTGLRAGWVDPYADEAEAMEAELNREIDPEALKAAGDSASVRNWTPDPNLPAMELETVSKPITKRVQKRCRHCGKDVGNHKAISFACPTGVKHRSLGYTQFHARQFYEAKDT